MVSRSAFLFAIAAATMTFGCGKSGNKSAPIAPVARAPEPVASAPAPQPAPSSTTAAAPMPTLGTPAYVLNLTSREMKIDGSRARNMNDARVKESKSLKSQLTVLTKLTKVVETKQGTAEFFVGKTLAIVADVANTPATVLWAEAPLDFKSIAYSHKAQAKAKEAVVTLVSETPECQDHSHGCHELELDLVFRTSRHTSKH